MLYNQIDELIANARKQGNKSELKVLKLIKAELIRSSKYSEITEKREIKILTKMAEVWKEEYRTLLANNRDTSVIIDEIDTLMGFIPELPEPNEVEDKEIEEYTKQVYLDLLDQSSSPISIKDLKTVISIVREKYPSADGKVISSTFKECLK